MSNISFSKLYTSSKIIFLLSRFPFLYNFSVINVLDVFIFYYLLNWIQLPESHHYVSEGTCKIQQHWTFSFCFFLATTLNPMLDFEDHVTILSLCLRIIFRLLVCTRMKCSSKENEIRLTKQDMLFDIYNTPLSQ